MDCSAQTDIIQKLDELFQTGEEAISYLLSGSLSTDSPLPQQIAELIQVIADALSNQYSCIELHHKLVEISQNAIATADSFCQTIGENDLETAHLILSIRLAPLFFFWHRYTMFFLQDAATTENLQQFHEAEREWCRTVCAENKIDEPRDYKYDLSIVVLFYGNQAMTASCIQAILEHTNSHSYELITFDNGSDLETTSWCNSLNHKKKIYYPVNMGSSTAGNLIFSTVSMYAEGKYLLFVSNDVIVTPEYDKILYACMESDPRIAVAVPLCNSASNLQAITVPYKEGTVEQIYQYGKQHNHLNPLKWYDRARLFAIAGMYRMSALEQSYLAFSPLFCYDMFADDDQCCVLRRMGYRQVLCRDVFVHHYGSATIGTKQFQVMDLGRQQFYSKYHVDAWLSLATEWNMFSQLPFSAPKKIIQVLALEPKFGEGILHIKNLLKECGVTHVTIHAVTLDSRYLDDARGLFDKVVVSVEETEEFQGTRYDLVLFGDLLENCSNLKRYLAICKQMMGPTTLGMALIGNPANIDYFLCGATGDVYSDDRYLHDTQESISRKGITIASAIKMFETYGLAQIARNDFYIESQKETARELAKLFPDRDQEAIIQNLSRYRTFFAFRNRG